MHAGATYKESIYSNLTLCIAALFCYYFSAPAECGLPPHIVEVVLNHVSAGRIQQSALRSLPTSNSRGG